MAFDYLVRRTKAKTYHLWTGKDTVCKMFLTGGLNKNKYNTVSSVDGLHLCTMCKNNQLKASNGEVKKPVNYVPNYPPLTSNDLILDVPYNKKDYAKTIGCLWDKDLKKWYAPSQEIKDFWNKTKNNKSIIFMR